MNDVLVVVTPVEFEAIAARLLPPAFSMVSETHRWRIYRNVTDGHAQDFRALDGASLGEVHVFPDIGDEGRLIMNWIRIDAEIRRRREAVQSDGQTI